MNSLMNDSRTTTIAAGSLLVAGSLWAPWYEIDFSSAAREAAGSQTSGLPAFFGEFARQLISLIPSHIEATAWQAFEKTDVVLLACAIVAIVAALVARMDIAGIAGGAAAGTTVLAMVSRPGPSEIVSLKWGAWIALAGALVIVAGSRMASARPAVEPSPIPDWTKPTAPISPAADPTHSFPPF